MLEKTLESKLDDYFAIVPKDLFEEAQEKAFVELDYEECTEEQCIMMIKEILQVENSFQLILISEEGDTQISLTWNDLDQKRVEEEYCEGCKTKQLRKSVTSLVEKMILSSDEVKTKKVKSYESQSSKQSVLYLRTENGILKWDKFGYENIHDKYVGEIKNNSPNGLGTMTWTDGSKLEGEWKDGKLNGKGTITWSNGERWVGQFYQDKRWNIVEYNSKGEIKGKWVNGIEQ